MTLNEKKLLRQLQGLEKWRRSEQYGSYKNGCGTLNYYTGVGKTYTAILIIKKFLENVTTNVVQVVVPTEALKIQWINQIQKIIPQFKENIKVDTVQQVIVNNTRKQVHLLIIDEVHEFLGDEWFGVIDGKYFLWSYGLGLTATFEDKHNRIDKLNKFLPIVDVIDEEEARKEGFISNYIEYNIGLELNEEELAEYRINTEIISRNLNKFGPAGFDGASKVLRGNERYTGFQFALMWAMKNGWRKDLDLSNEVDRGINDLWNPKKIIGYANNIMTAVRIRKEIIYTAQSKLNTIISLVKKFDKLKTICFSQSTKFADALEVNINKELGGNTCVVYHSKLQSRPLKDSNGEYIRIKGGAKKGEIKIFGKKFLRDYAINEMKSGNARILSTSAALDKGLDIEEIEFGITSSGTANPVQNKQRKGRSIRLKTYKPDTLVLIVNLYIKNTKDEDSLRERQKDNINEIYWIDSIDEIGEDKLPDNSNIPNF